MAGSAGLPARAINQQCQWVAHLWRARELCGSVGIDTQGWARRNKPMLSTILIIILILLLIGALPTWPYSANWGYGPGGGVGLLLVIIVVLVLLGRI